MNAVSLFSGIGAFDLGVSLAGFNIVAQAEIDEYCRKVLKRHAPAHWPNAIQFVRVEHINSKTVTQPIDLVFGGFPCQPFSLAGDRKGAHDERNGWPAMRNAISSLRPRAVMLENVTGITQATTLEGELQPAYALTVVADLAAMGYDAQWGVISARDADAAHIRERWWCVAYASGARIQKRNVATINKRPRHHFRAAGQRRLQRLHESGMDRAAHATASGLDITRRPAYQGEDQHDWEAPRVTQTPAPHLRNRIKALGNSGMWQIAYALAKDIAANLY